MIRSDDVLDLIERIYEAATTPAAWGAFLERSTDAVGGLSSTLLRQDVSTHTVPVAIADRVDPHFRALYERHYAAAQAIFAQGDGLTLHRDGIHAERPDEERKLRRLVAAALRPSSDEEPPVDGALRITRPSLQRPFPMLVSRLRAGRHQLGGRYAAAVVFVTDPEAEIDAVEEVLTGFYGMTAAESAVARLLVQGRRVEEVAARLRISTNTVRTHLKRAFGKTGTAGQTDLVAARGGARAGVVMRKRWWTRDPGGRDSGGRAATLVAAPNVVRLADQRRSHGGRHRSRGGA